jgi:catechol 2,3-dioxygenase-like lactoylglutathione lyase family enzyme
MALDHSALVCADIARARRFYVTVLGLEEIPRPASFRFGGCWFRGHGFELHMILAGDTTAPAGFGDAGPAAQTGLAHHLGFEVDDLEAVAAQLRAHDVPIVAGPMQRGDGIVQMYVNDPDGNFLEFFTRRPDPAAPAFERAAVSHREPGADS